MKKAFYVSLGIIVVLLIVIVLQALKINEYNTHPNKIEEELNNDVKKYVGIYHTSYYGQNGRPYDESIRLNQDGTCKLINDSNCTWKLKSDNVILITTYAFYGGITNENDILTSRVFGAKTKEDCEKSMKELNAEGECKRIEKDNNLDIVNSGLMYNERIYNKVN